MSLQDLPSRPAGGHWDRLWSTVLDELWEIIWLVAIVSALSVASVGLAVVLAGA